MHENENKQGKEEDEILRTHIYTSSTKDTSDLSVVVLHEDFADFERSGCYLFFDFDVPSMMAIYQYELWENRDQLR